MRTCFYRWWKKTAFWLPTEEPLDLRGLFWHRHQLLHMQIRIQNALQAIVLAHGLRRGSSRSRVACSVFPIPEGLDANLASFRSQRIISNRWRIERV